MFKRILTAVWSFIKSLFTANIGLKIVALLMAVLLWAYVLNDENPYRVKSVTGVNLSFEGEAELLAKGLCVRGNRSDILKNVTVAVKTQIANYSSLGTSQVNATVSLRNISEARTYELPVVASVSSGYGVIQSISPGTITVEIDSLVKKTIPITPIFEGTLPEGYWADMEASSVTARIDIEGPKTDISTVKRAECFIDLSNSTSLLYSTYDLVMYDGNDEVVDGSIIVGTIPSATVRVPIYPEKYVPIDLQTALTGVDALQNNRHDVMSVTSSPETVRIVGEAAVLEKIDKLSVTPVDVSSQTDFESYTTSLIIPEGVRLPDENTTVSIGVDVKEHVEEAAFDTVAVVLHGIADEMNATSDVQTVSINIVGPFSIVNALTRSAITVSAELANLTEGEYDIPLEVTFANPDIISSVSYTVFDANGKQLSTVHVSISPKEQ